MRSIVHLFAAAAIGSVIVLSGTTAFAKTSKECNAEYAAHKSAMASTKQTKAQFIKACLADKATTPMTHTEAPMHSGY